MILTSDSPFEPLGTWYRIRDKRTVFVSDVRALAQPGALQSELRYHPDELNGSLFPVLTPLFLITHSKSRRIQRSRSVVSWGGGGTESASATLPVNVDCILGVKRFGVPPENLAALTVPAHQYITYGTLRAFTILHDCLPVRLLSG